MALTAAPAPSQAQSFYTEAGKPYAGTTLTARRLPSPVVSELMLPDPKQDRKPRTRELKRKVRVRWLYGEDPNPTADVFNTEAIQQLVHLSPMGF